MFYNQCPISWDKNSYIFSKISSKIEVVKHTNKENNMGVSVMALICCNRRGWEVAVGVASYLPSCELFRLEIRGWRIYHCNLITGHY